MDYEDKIKKILQEGKIVLMRDHKISNLMSVANQIKHSDLEPDKKKACYDALLVIADITGDLSVKTMLISRIRSN